MSHLLHCMSLTYLTLPVQVRVVAKTVQAWISDKKYEQEYAVLVDEDGRGGKWWAPEDPYSHEVLHPLMERLGRKLEWFTRLKIGERHSATEYQVTNYG